MAALASSSVAADKPVAPPSPPAKPSAGPKVADAGPAWKSLFDGKTLAGWKVTDFAGQTNPIKATAADYERLFLAAM